MTKRQIDMRGCPCPEPVVATKRALEDPDITELEVRVSSEAALENVSRMGRNLGCDVTLESTPKGDHRAILRRESVSDARQVSCDCASKNLVVLIPTDRFGEGDPDLGRALLHAFIGTIKEMSPRPSTVIFVNNGAKLACEGSEFVKPIRDIDGLGCEILVCGTCLDFYNLDQKVQVGRVSNMLEIATTLAAADKIIRV